MAANRDARYPTMRALSDSLKELDISPGGIKLGTLIAPAVGADGTTLPTGDASGMAFASSATIASDASKLAPPAGVAAAQTVSLGSTTREVSRTPPAPSAPPKKPFSRQLARWGTVIWGGGRSVTESGW
ncbi:MAG: hypothetical protein HRU17_12425 [Polyangiaceae bacterium]|nr:hypothetical protein [Polyangiaceae bacterium]